MPLQSKLLTCRCLNVQLIYDPNEQQHQQTLSSEKIIEIFEHKSNHNEHRKSNLDPFLMNSKLFKIIPGGIKINYEYLCLKRLIQDNLQITFCAICESETHAIFISKSLPYSKLSNYLLTDANLSNGSIAFVNASLLSDENSISELKSSKNFSPALGIVLPDRSFEDNQSMQEDSGIVSEKMKENTYFLVSNFIQEDVADKIRLFLKQEKSNMHERIKQYSSQQEKQFQQLFQTTLNNKQSFLKMIEAIKIRHNIDNINDENKFTLNDDKDYDNNKENRDNSLLQRRSNDLSFNEDDKNSNQFEDVYYKKISTTSDLPPSSLSTMHTIGKNSEEFDSIFDIDDLDANNFDGQSSSIEQRVNSADELDDDLNDERRDNVFPLKETQQQFSFKQTFMNDEIEHRNNKRNISASMASHHYYTQQKNGHNNFHSGHSDDHEDYNSRNYSSQQIANSLPIQIPYFSRRNNREIEESFRINPGESMAESIQKMARSVRNEVDILDDRPRRRLNTCDLIKSRPFFN